MTETALLDMVRQIPQSKRQELYDFAYFLVEKYADTYREDRIAAFESEDEMLAFIRGEGLIPRPLGRSKKGIKPESNYLGRTTYLAL